jgi:hypothetical protein
MRNVTKEQACALGLIEQLANGTATPPLDRELLWEAHGRLLAELQRLNPQPRSEGEALTSAHLKRSQLVGMIAQLRGRLYSWLGEMRSVERKALVRKARELADNPEAIKAGPVVTAVLIGKLADLAELARDDENEQLLSGTDQLLTQTAFNLAPSDSANPSSPDSGFDKTWETINE